MELMTIQWGWNFFYLIGIIITFFLSSLLLIKKGKTKADYILAVWLLILGAHLLQFYIIQSYLYREWPYLLGFGIPMPLLHGPFLYLYTAELTGQFPKKMKWLVHFLPAIAAYIVIAPFLLLPFSDKIFVYDHDGQGYETEILLITSAIYISGIVYIVLSLILLKKHRLRILNQYSDTEKINLNWLRYLIIGMAAIWLPVLLSNDNAIYLAVVLFVLFVGYFGIRQVGILNNNFGKTEAVTVPEVAIQIDDALTGKTEDDETEQVRYQKSRLPQVMIDRIHGRLTQAMREEKLFMDPELTLGDLGKKLQVHPNSLSQVINLVEGKNFYDYINLYRVEAFEKLLSEGGNQKYTILSLAFECGFNSKASFNRNFKKYRGITPTEYQKQATDEGSQSS